MDDNEQKPEQEEPTASAEAPDVAQAPQPVPPVSGIKLFGKYEFDDLVVKDVGMKRYLDLTPVAVPHTGGKHAVRQFAKARMNITERLINNMMRTEKWTGKKLKAYKAVEGALDIVAKRASSNPLQILIDAIQNAGPREEVTRLQYGGISVPKAVDVAPSRRVDLALRNICNGALESSHGSTKSISVCLAEEIMLAAKNDMNSYSIAKKEEIERVAASAR
ncbi:MAG: 30S ribosomal protein S7 [Thermoplasmata archaeon]|nr:30S ribosomal protein S7 [Thermoplasmata archaeon]